jgi:hypothetical protein
MTTAPPTPRTAAANQARQRTTQAMLHRVSDAITLLRRQRTPVTFPAVARRAQVSRTFLYENPTARMIVTDATQRTSGLSSHRGEDETPWRERALNAEDALKAAHAEIRTQRDRIGQLLGIIRDLERHYPEETVQRVISENTTLKQRLRELSHDNRTLDEKLQAARSNNRFQDRRTAQLEAQLLEHGNQHT